MLVTMMYLSGDLWPSRISVLLVWYVGSMCLEHVLVTGTSVQSWQHLLKHPHYADDGHQHARHGTARSRNTRLEDTQGVSTEFPKTLYSRNTSTTKAPRTTTTDFTKSPTVASRTYFTTSRPSVTESNTRHHAANNHNSSSVREPPSSSVATISPYAGPSRTASSRETPIIATPAARSRSQAVTFPPRDYYNVDGSPEGSHAQRENPESSEQPKKPGILSAIRKELENVKLANEHFLLMRDLGRCKEPRAQVVRVKDIYPDPTKEYAPRCTLLHRCNDQAGCCDNEDFQCMPKAMQEVALNFYVIPNGKESHFPDLSGSVTKLFFVNHTECECLPVDNLSRVTEKPSTSQQNDHHHHVDPNTIQNHPAKCQECPLPFCKREYPDGRCSCDCFDRQRPCLRIKRGREAMQESERRCVELGKCHVPECEYGTFDAMLGRCPRRPEDHQRKNNHNHHQKNHRWTFFERD